MLKIYTGEILNYAYAPILYPNLGFLKRDKNLFTDNAFKNFKKPVFEIANKPEKADYFLLPHDYFLISKEKKYINSFSDLAEKYGKKIMIFAHGDSDNDIPVRNSIIFRTSKYGEDKKSNEIMMPAYAEDLLGSSTLEYRQKKDKPTVGFCGWVLSKNLAQKIFLALKNIIKSGNRKTGLWFRQRIVKVLQKSSLVKTNFILRNSFSGHKATINISPSVARKEYLDNMLNSDFALAVKGYGNFSIRFYESLSLGRIPVFVDTDCILPFEDRINYKEFVLFVDYTDIEKIDVIITDFYKGLSEEQFSDMQKKARKAFEEYLRIDAFFRKIPAILGNLKN